MPLDPISIGLGGAQTLLGIGQSLFSGRKKYERQLEDYAKTWKPNAGILDYYNKALAKYSPNAYQSAEYQNRSNQIQRNLAGGISAAQNRRSGLMAIAGATQQANDALGRAAGQAEQAQRSNLSQLGQATGMQAAEKQRGFDMMYNLKAMKAGQAASRENAGIRNIFGGIGTAATLGLGTTGGRSKQPYEPNADDIAGMQRMPYNPSLLNY